MRSLRSFSVGSRAPHGRSLPSTRLRGALVSLAITLLLALVGLAGVVGVAPVAAQDRPPGGAMANPLVRAIDLASPAVVRIATLYSAHVRLTACGVTTSLPASGAYTIGGLGSGAFVSANGDILTADHVVDIDRQSLDSVIFSGERVSTDVAAFLNAACHPSVPVTPDDVANGIVQFNGLPFSTTYSAPRVLVWRSASYFGTISSDASNDATTQLSALMQAAYDEATVVKTSSFEQDDIALIHVGLKDTPSIRLDPSSELAVEDALTVIGFPGNGDVNGDPTNLLTPSVNNVSVSAIKRNGNGSQLIQVGGNVEHGDSGGPALDAAGHIVGVVSFGGVDSPGITAFLRSSDSALALVRSAQIDTTPGAFQKLWEKAFAAYADTTPGHWRAASQEMRMLSARYPDFHGLDAYRAYADSAAARESPATPAFQPPDLPLPLPLPVIAAIAAAVILLLLLLIIVSSVRRRARRRAREQAAAIAQPAQPAWTPASAAYGDNHLDARNGYAASPYGSPYSSTYGSSNGAPYAPYNAPAPPTRPVNGQAQPVSYPQRGDQQDSQQGAQAPYQRAAAPAPYTPAPVPAPYPGYPLRAYPPAPLSGPPSAPSSASASAAPSQGGPSQPGPAAYNGRPASYSGPASAPSPSQTGATPGAYASEFCVNGHRMPPGAPRCPVCGAERAWPAPTAPRNASVPPSGQTW